MPADKGAGWTGSRRSGTGRIAVRRGVTNTKGPAVSTTRKGTGVNTSGKSFKNPSPGRQF